MALEKEKITYEIFDSIEPNPLISTCHAAGKKARETSADFIIGIGGGSVLDATKASAIYATNGELEPMQIYNKSYKNRPLPIALIGTTAGTGSEVTGISVLTQDESGRKKSISGEDCYAKFSFLDPKYTYSVPYEITVSTALDALAHTVEGWFGHKMNDVISLFAHKAMHMLWQNIKHMAEEKELTDKKRRDELYYGSIYAGLVINACGTCFPHPVGYALTEIHGVPHGKACAAFMPLFLERAEEFEPEKLKALLGTVGETRQSFSQTVSKLNDLKSIKITADEAKRCEKNWQNEEPEKFKASPGGLTPKEAVQMLVSLNLE